MEKVKTGERKGEKGHCSRRWKVLPRRHQGKVMLDKEDEK